MQLTYALFYKKFSQVGRHHVCLGAGRLDGLLLEFACLLNKINFKCVELNYRDISNSSIGQ